MFERLESVDKRILVRVAIGVLVGIVLLSSLAGGIRQAGWNEGFLVGLVAGNGDGQALAPYLAYQTSHGWNSGGLGLIGGLFKLLFFGFLLMTLFKVIGFWRWRMHGRSADWHHHGPWHQRSQPQAQAQQGATAQPEPDRPAEHKPQNKAWIDV